jgi:hypothetical protein
MQNWAEIIRMQISFSRVILPSFHDDYNTTSFPILGWALFDGTGYD